MPDTGMPDQSRLDMPEPEYRRRVNHEAPDPSMRRLALGAVAVCAVVLGGVWLLAVNAGPHKVPIIRPDAKPLRVKPQNPGGMQVDGLNDAMLNGGPGPEADKLAPPPEVPAPQALAAQEGGTPPQAGAAPAAPPAPSASATSAQPAPVSAAPVLAAPPPMTLGPAAPVAASGPPVAAAPAAPAVTSQNSAGSVSVQLGALPSRAAAEAEWRHLLARLAGPLAGHTPEITSVTHGGRVLWRLRTGGFADIASATEFCTKARAAGAACAIADF